MMTEPARLRKNWSKEEVDFLQDKWGTLPIGSIAKKVGRNHSAVVQKAQRLGLPAFLDSGADPSLNQVYGAIYGGRKIDAYTVNRWLAAGLPIKNKKVRNCKYRVVDINKFWEWAEQHKDLINLALMPRYALGAEPDWVKIKRRADYDERIRTKPHNQQWSPAEDLTLSNMYRRQKHTWDEIARAVGRTEGACRKRVKYLGLDGSAVRHERRKWTNEEMLEMLDMKQAGYSDRQIGEKLHRSARSVESRYAAILNPGYSNRENRRKHGLTYKGMKGINPKDVAKIYQERMEKKR